MRFIVSPAKKMNVVDDAFGWRDAPAFLARTKTVLEAIRTLSYDEAKSLWKCSDALAELNYERFQSMNLRDFLTAAVLAYEGIQYQHMSPQVMQVEQLEYLQDHLRILSGFYGVLRPLDGVVPYRLEMQAKLPIAGAKDLYEFWGSSLYDALAAETDAIVNLASVEYAKAVLPYAAKAAEGPRVVTCLFGSVENGKLVQRSTAAKAARGSMVRWCAENNAQHPSDLKQFDVAGYAFDPERSSESCLVFVQQKQEARHA